MATIPAPVDPTATPAWAALEQHLEELRAEGISLKKWFAEDPQRVEKLSFDMKGLLIDLSKNLVTDKTMELLVDLARACDARGEYGDKRQKNALLHKVHRPIQTNSTEGSEHFPVKHSQLYTESARKQMKKFNFFQETFRPCSA